MIIEFPSSKQVLDTAPKYTGNLSLYFDITRCLNFSITDNVIVFFYCLFRNGHERFYKISHSEQEISEIYNSEHIFILGYPKNIIYSDEDLKDFLEDILLESNIIERYEVSIKIDTSNDDFVEILFIYNRTLYIIRYERSSKYLIECLLYEYFTHISYINIYNDLFEFSESQDFYIRGTDLSLKQFFQKYFGNCFGDFKSGNTLSIDSLFNISYNWRFKLGDLADNLNTSRTEFLLFSDITPPNKVICDNIKTKLAN